ncbi:alpha/beta fold hydrolase [Paracoccus sp. Z330]|uniref:Alpha/beta fold hydrolase n=1 Tax=Paracoccus onchidii TaxID=3017813 RepID=A0ABT4ZJX9_9RHOB|nr:alpha/beta fold hydrolase [Paracoccus onchidii]MDB6179681.1 alpha/beta fold hydrolase [Paracoccus onchidii]
MSWRKLAILAILAFGAFWYLVPHEHAELVAAEINLPEDLDAWLSDREQGIDPARAGRIDWRGPPGQRTDLALIYVHGFSGHPSELDPVPQEVAEAVGANLYSVRLAGHGAEDEALARANVAQWWDDVAEAVAVGERLGDRIVLIGLSTGGTLAALAAVDEDLGRRIDAVVLLSPNFGVHHRYFRLLNLPFSRQLVRLLMPKDRCGDNLATKPRGFMSPCPAIEAAIPLAALVRRASGTDFSVAHQPAFFIWSYADNIVMPKATDAVADRWGGRATRLNVTPSKQDDPHGHIIAGEDFSPRLSPLMVKAISIWIGQLGES